MIGQLYSHIRKLVPDFSVAPEQIAPFFETKQVKKEEFLLNENEICDTIYFVNKGSLYMFYNQHDVKKPSIFEFVTFLYIQKSKKPFN